MSHQTNKAVGGILSTVGNIGRPSKDSKNNAKRAKLSAVPKDGVKIYTFSIGKSPAHFQVSSLCSLGDLIAIAFDVCDPALGEGPGDHMWNLKVGGKVYESGDFPCASSLRAERTRISDLPTGTLTPKSELYVEYDYGNTSKHVLTLLKIEDPGQDFDASAFPRKKPVASVATPVFLCDQVNLDTLFPMLNKRLKKSYEINFFQAGRRRGIHGTMRGGSPHLLTCLVLAEKPESLQHSLAMHNQGASMRWGGETNWHSVVVLPAGTPNFNKYDVEDGFCDVITVAPPSEPDLNKLFPKVAALAGFRKDKNVPKGWIRYHSNVLQVISGTGSESAAPRAPKFTALPAEGVYAPGPSDKIIFQLEQKFDSVHALLCKVEGFLMTLKKE